MKVIMLVTVALLLACGSDVTGPQGTDPLSGYFLIETQQAESLYVIYRIDGIETSFSTCDSVNGLLYPFSATDSLYVFADVAGGFITVSIVQSDTVTVIATSGRKFRTAEVEYHW